MTYTKGQNVVGLENLVRKLAASMVTAGFTVVAVDGAAGSTIGSSAKTVVLAPTAALDTLYENQKWSVILSGSDAEKTLAVHVLPTSQINDLTFEPVLRKADAEVGRISVDGLTANYFIDLAKDWKIDAAADFAAYPFSYDLVTSDHGIALQINAEGLDNTGTAFSWLVVQRGVVAETGAVDPNSPLFAIFSIGGGQLGNPDTLNEKSIQRFTVIERDINAATAPISAVVPSPDGIPVINPMQQVMIAEGNKAIVLFPHMINTHRYLYHIVLDMLGYTSADVISAASNVDVTPASIKKTYRAMNANGKDNRGMRILFPIADVVEP